MFTPDDPPQTARFQEKREAILGAAAALFNERGVKGATLADIAGSVGLVTNSVTYYYRKKEDLATACFLRTIEIYDGFAIEAASEQNATLRLRCFFRKHAELLASIELKQAPQIVVFNDLRALPNPQLDIAFSAYTDMFRRIRALLKGPETSGLTRDALNARTHIVLSTTNGMRAWMGRFEADEYTRIADRMTDIVINGFVGKKSQWRSVEA